jgi:hypothetical protein
MVIVCFGACSSLKLPQDPALGSDAGADGNGGDGGNGLRFDAAPGSDARATLESGTSAQDFDCPLAWVSVSAVKPECAPRQVRVVDESARVGVTGVSIARTAQGRVGIAYNSVDNADMGSAFLAHFAPKSPGYRTPTIVSRARGLSSFDGYSSRLAAIAPDTLAVLSFDREGLSGEVHIRKLVGGAEPLTDELLVTGVKSPTELALAADSTGTLYAAVRIATTPGVARLATYIRPNTGPIVALGDIARSLRTEVAPWMGAASLHVDSTDQVHLLYAFNDPVTEPQHSIPRYHTLAGSVWSDRKTVDNAVIGGLSGLNPRIAAFGTKKSAAYFFRKAQQAPPETVELRLATWDSSLDAPQIEILEQKIPAADLQNPSYRVAMAIDTLGLVHLVVSVVLQPDIGNVRYMRQVRLPSGAIKWLTDVVDGDAVANRDPALIDLVVDENARPHIAYRSSKDGKLRYATRFDR